MKKFGFLAILGLVLLSSISTSARPQNYIKSRSRLMFCYNGGYVDMVYVTFT
ncbi:hypothetical protein [Flavobacterium psychrophilum]|uniref:Uncharacterized protein n=1 Tax=Flavobacterium psychrophilum (strain ATCC 49511 / DSM 21280 / CIP 103535 / JIP02/86) TaxID=402612 RepID=A6GWA5_FLAPJ|nr:hypothetical protein [Flavobacterium psychrophilum]AIJ36790.1 hypothetical protein FPSM_00295 [Flavobacterium psychrophilum]EKT3974962.1 hypothetical protein [Flavobacterium psychrophilum]EKT4518432.1 hypothetical protein [Flavobacterium psychrophilum]EKT4527294.1 hypothetical protein [Flavobacterium psychrophilum]EKT4535206.1 hypothetical protein [Flavobacterium psychrophilum]